MSDASEGRGWRWLSALGLVLLPLVCCGLPLLIAAGALGAVGSVLSSPWLLGGALAIVAGAVVWVLQRRPGARVGGCCSPGGGVSGPGHGRQP